MMKLLTSMKMILSVVMAIVLFIPYSASSQGREEKPNMLRVGKSTEIKPMRSVENKVPGYFITLSEKKFQKLILSTDKRKELKENFMAIIRSVKKPNFLVP